MTGKGDGESLTELVSKIQSSEPHTFTTSHTMLASVALRSRSYDAAIPILDSDIYRVQSESTDGASPTQHSFLQSDTRYQEVVSYFLYGGMIYLAVGNYDRAILFLELATVYPASGVPSRIQVEAYKKWILINLFHHGKQSPLIRTLTGLHQRILSSLAKPYEEIAEVFSKSSFQRLAETVDVGRQIWAEDLNEGLIALVIHAHQRFAVSRLSKIYSSISIRKVHELSFSPTRTHNEVYEYLSNLIAAGQLSATLTPPGADIGDSFLRFISSNPEGAEVENDRVIQARQQQAKLETLNEYVKNMTHTLQLTRPYLEVIHKNKRKGGAAGEDGKNGGLHPGVGGGLYDDDEYLEVL